MSLTREQLFELWAPTSSPWSVWAKPVLFSFLRAPPADEPSPERDIAPPDIAPWAPAADGATAIVVDLPGAHCVRLGEALVLAGFRPVPLFNAVPSATGLVDVQPIAHALHGVSERVAVPLSSLPAAAPPAFLLDANRREGRPPRPGDFDNRSISLPTDFPSASLLQSRGVARVLLVVAAGKQPSAPAGPANDLAHTLLRWQIAGLPIHSCSLTSSFEASPLSLIEVARPSRFGALWHNALSLFGLRRNPLGGFGGTLPLPSSG